MSAYRWSPNWNSYVPTGEAPVEPMQTGAQVVMKAVHHRCGDIDCLECWNAGVRYADYEQAKRMEDWWL